MSYNVLILIDNDVVYEEAVPTWSCVRCILAEPDVRAYQVYDLSSGRPRLYDIDGHEHDLVKIDQYIENKFISNTY